MRSIITAGTVLAAVSGAFSASAAGFALYEGSASGMALSGAVMGRAVDAAANFYNPATIADFTNTVVSVGLALEIPRTDVSVRGSDGSRYEGRMCPGTFLLPHAYVVQPLAWGFTFGLGLAPEYGLGTEYSDSWPLGWNSVETTVEGFVVNPNLTYAVTDDWAVSAGFRLLYATFEQYSRPHTPYYPAVPGQLRNHLEADNGFSDWGWTVSTRYRITKDLSAGIMYRSHIDASVRGDNVTQPGTVPPPYGVAMSRMATGRCGAKMRLPQSISAGLNWDATETLHLGYAMTWTRWSSIDKLDFDLPTGVKSTKLDWEDVFRFSVAASWDFADDWTLMGSYAYDIDPCQTSKNVGTTMLPSGDRHILSGGLAWRWKGFEVAACYGIILMSSRDQIYQESAVAPEYRFSTRHGLSHQVGVTVSYGF